MSFNVFLVVLIILLFFLFIPLWFMKIHFLNKIHFFLQTDDDAECIETFQL